MKRTRFPFFGGSRLMSNSVLEDREKRRYESGGRGETRQKSCSR
jgi:hypothetical protein